MNPTTPNDNQQEPTTPQENFQDPITTPVTQDQNTPTTVETGQVESPVEPQSYDAPATTPLQPEAMDQDTPVQPTPTIDTPLDTTTPIETPETITPPTVNADSPLDFTNDQTTDPTDAPDATIQGEPSEQPFAPQTPPAVGTPMPDEQVDEKIRQATADPLNTQAPVEKKGNWFTRLFGGK